MDSFLPFFHKETFALHSVFFLSFIQLAGDFESRTFIFAVCLDVLSVPVIGHVFILRPTLDPFPSLSIYVFFFVSESTAGILL